VVDSHGDLDRKNTVRRADGVLLALDWDAAGPVGAVHEAAGLALDWSAADPAVFAAAVHAYVRRSGVTIPAQPWIFAGWVAAQGGWLDYNAPWVALAALAIVAGAAALAGAPLGRLRPGGRALAAAAVLLVSLAWAYALAQRGTIAG